MACFVRYFGPELSPFPLLSGSGGWGTLGLGSEISKQNRTENKFYSNKLRFHQKIGQADPVGSGACTCLLHLHTVWRSSPAMRMQRIITIDAISMDGGQSTREENLAVSMKKKSLAWLLWMEGN